MRRKLRRAFVLTTAVVVLNAPCLSTQGEAYPLPTSMAQIGGTAPIRAILYHALVTGVAPPGTIIQATLRDSEGGGRVAAEGTAIADDTAAFRLVLASGGEPARMRPGQRLLLSFAGGRAFDLLLPSLQVEADNSRDELRGTASPGAVVNVTVDGVPDLRVTTIAHDDGSFVAQLGPYFDVVAGSSGMVVARRADEWEVALPWASPQIEVQLGEAMASGVAASGTSLAITLFRSGFAAAHGITMVGSRGDVIDHHWSAVLANPAGLTLPVQVGDHIACESAGFRADLEVPKLAIEANPVADWLMGTIPPWLPATVRVVALDGRSFERTVTVGQSEQFHFDLVGEWDLQPGDRVILTAVAAEGRTRLSAALEVVSLEVGLDDGRLSGYAWPLKTVAAFLVRGPTVIATATASTTASGRFEVVLRRPDGRLAPPEAGAELVIDHGPGRLRAQIPELVVERLMAGMVAGRATPGGQVRLRITDVAEQPGAAVEAIVAPDMSGDFAFQLPAALGEAASVRIEAAYVDTSGNRFHRLACSGWLRAQLGGTQVMGQLSPSVPITVTVLRDGQPLARTSTMTRTDGSFDLQLADDQGNVLVIATGDRIVASPANSEMAGCPKTIAHDVMPLEVALDPVNRRLAGQTVAEGQVTVLAQTPDGAPVLTGRALADWSGRFELGAPRPPNGESWAAGTCFEVSVRDGAGQATFVRAIVPLVTLTVSRPNVQGLAAPLVRLTGRLERGTVHVGQLVARPDTFGVYGAWFRAADGSIVPIGIGDRLVLEGATGPTIALIIPRLTIELDRREHTLRGWAPAGSRLQVHLVAMGRPPLRILAFADSQGQWLLQDEDLPPYAGYDLGNVEDAWVTIELDNGHLITAELSDSTVTVTATPETASPTATATATARKNVRPLAFPALFAGPGSP